MVAQIVSIFFGVITFFLIFFIGKSLIISLICTIIVYVICFFLFSSGVKKNDTNSKISEKLEIDKDKQLLANTQLELHKIYELNTRIKNQEVKNQISEILDSAYKILNFINQKKEKINDVSNFLEYYIPATFKIVNNYYTIVENKASLKNYDDFSKKVLSFLTEIKEAFTKQLNALCDDEIVDASIEMETLKTALLSEGLLNNNDFDK